MPGRDRSAFTLDMKSDPAAPLMLGFMIPWVLFGVGSLIFVHTRPVAAQKRLWFRRFCIFGGIVFGIFTVAVFAAWGKAIFSLIFLQSFFAL